MNEVMQFISQVGFPIACCVFLMYQNAKQDDHFRQQQDELRKSIDNNTDAIKELARMIKKE